MFFNRNKVKLYFVNDFGFTLIELLLVLVIISVTVVLAIPNFNKMLSNYQLDISARQMASDIRDLQQTAIKTQNTALSMEYILNTGVYRWLNENNTIKPLALPDGIVITAAPTIPDANIKRLRFAANGRPLYGFGGTVELKDSSTGKKKYVIIDTLGRVRVSDTQ